MKNSDILLFLLYAEEDAKKIADSEIRELFNNLVFELRYLFNLSLRWQSDQEAPIFKKLPSDERVLALSQSDALGATIQILIRRIQTIHNNQKGITGHDH